MANDTTADGVVLAADGLPLKASLNRAMRKSRIRALLLVTPLFVFVLFFLSHSDIRHVDAQRG